MHLQPIKGAQVVPGPCLPIGCPPPTEIVCIEVPKVYDFCFQAERRENVCFLIPDACTPPVPVGATVTCNVINVSCTEISRTPTATAGFFDVTLMIVATLSITIINPDGTERCTFETPFTFMKTVTLCAPEGTEVVCSAANVRCGPCVIVSNQVCCEIDLCIIIQSIAIVKLLVPSYGFCVPEECVVLPKPPLSCPPEPFFPPQCTPGS